MVGKKDRPGLEVLGQVALFHGLSDKELTVIYDRMKPVTYTPGEEIATQGARSGRFFLIVDGTAHVTVNGERRGQLARGESFGEISMLDGGERSATITADTAMTVLAVSTVEFRALLHEQPAMVDNVIARLCTLLRAERALAAQRSH